MLITILTSIGAVIAIAIVVIQNYAKQMEEKKTSEYRNKLEQAQNKIIALTTENKNLTHELYMYSTGGDAFCYIHLHEDAAKKNIFYLTVINASDKYPLKNVAAKINDQNNISFRLEDINKNSINIGDLPIRGASQIAQATILYPDNKLRLFVQYSSENKHFTQVIRMKKQNGVWCYGTRVSEFITDKLLYEQVDDCYKDDIDFK